MKKDDDESFLVLVLQDALERLNMLFQRLAIFICLALRLASGFPFPTHIPRSRQVSTTRRHSSTRTQEGLAEEASRIRDGATLLVNGRAVNSEKIRELATTEDFVATGGNVPLVLASVSTALTGQVDNISYMLCAIVTVATGLAHWRMYETTERDWRAPRLGEARTTYQFSAIYLVAFGWLLARVNPLFPTNLEVLDIAMATVLTIIVVYGFLYPVFAKAFFQSEASKAKRNPVLPVLEPSSEDFQNETQLLLTGQVVINILAGLFIPFTWVLVNRGTEWWLRVTELHENQAAFLGVSILTAIIGDDIGNLLLRLRDKEVITSWPADVFAGLVLNFTLLLLPELCFNVFYNSGVSETGFYFE